MKTYDLPSRLFKKRWIWFEEPHEVDDADMVTFFSYSDASPNGFSKKGGLTSVIDLSRGLDVVWNGMRQRFIREQILKGEKNNIQVFQSADFDTFTNLYEKFRSDKGLSVDDMSLFRSHGLLFLASHNGTTLAGGVFIHDTSTMRAWALASRRFESSGRMRELAGQANRMLLWHALQYAAQHGIQRFDLGGLDSSSTTDVPSSLVQFKDAFGGERVQNWYYSKVYSPYLAFLLHVRSYIPV